MLTLELGAFGGADANAAGVDLGAACTAAVCVRDTATGRELLGLAITDVFGSSVVGGQGESRDGNCRVKGGQYVLHRGHIILGKGRMGEDSQARTVVRVMRTILKDCDECKFEGCNN